MSNGYTGKILRVNLSDGTISQEEQDELFYRRYFGGVGLIAYYLLKADDQLPARMHEPFEGGPLKGVAIGKDDLDKAIQTYYKIMGWDEETGVPTREKLAELGVEWVAELLGE